MDAFLSCDTLGKVVLTISKNIGDCHQRVRVERETTYISSFLLTKSKKVKMDFSNNC